ncbi:Ewing's tumor-associated antigen 1 [Gossypium arboreum]|uniref:Ewing's tumor-associated antigen 1 n=1 Tax=Gossypium arboreum TaxID=29729 RepID=A0A0B0NYR8_GOSAR|nr:Ewing's tumor-associated antigen 1 [Gossypium arboreum]
MNLFGKFRQPSARLDLVAYNFWGKTKNNGKEIFIERKYEKNKKSKYMGERVFTTKDGQNLCHFIPYL